MVELPGEDERDDATRRDEDLVPLDEPTEPLVEPRPSPKPASPASAYAATSTTDGPSTPAVAPDPSAAPAPLPSRWRASSVWLRWMWAVVAGWLLVAALAGWNEIGARAANQVMLVVPRDYLNDAERRALGDEIAAAPEVDALAWLSPQQVAERSARRIPRGAWNDLFSEEDVWLPWIAEVRFRSVFASPETPAALAETLSADARIQLALWDEEGVAALLAEWRRWLLGFGGIGILWLALGTAALRLGRSPRVVPPGGSASRALADGLIAAAFIALSAGVFFGAGWPIAWPHWAAAAVLGFALATFVAPVIEGQRP